MVVAIIVGLGCILFGYKPIGKGLILGALFSTINFIVMGETLPWRVGQTKKKATFISMGSILFRYAMLGVPIFMGLKYQQYNIITVVIGLFLLQLLILGEQLIKMATSRRGKQR